MCSSRPPAPWVWSPWSTPWWRRDERCASSRSTQLDRDGRRRLSSSRSPRPPQGRQGDKRMGSGDAPRQGRHAHNKRIKLVAFIAIGAASAYGLTELLEISHSVNIPWDRRRDLGDLYP